MHSTPSDVQLRLVIGLPASGKTTRARELEKDFDLERLSDWPGWDRKRSKERHQLYDSLRQGRSFVIDCSGFCNSRYLDYFLRELSEHVLGNHYEIEYFENKPLQCMRLALKDPKRRYGEAGILARISQILRWYSDYRPAGPIIHQIPQCETSTRCLPETSDEKDELLRQIKAAITRNGQLLVGANFDTNKKPPEQDRDIERIETADQKRMIKRIQKFLQLD